MTEFARGAVLCAFVSVLASSAVSDAFELRDDCGVPRILRNGEAMPSRFAA